MDTPDQQVPDGHYGPVVPIGVTTVLELIDREIAAHPGRNAVEDPERSVTYGELDRLATTAASALRERFGVGRGDVVVVAAEAGAAFTAAVLGILRAGAAYLPIDLSYPAERISSISRASAAKLVVTTAGPGPWAAIAGQVTPQELFAGSDGARPSPRLLGNDAAYVIFTSGSTGAPKGIVQTHRCLANFVSWQVDASGLGRGRRVLQCAPLSFDVSVQEIFTTLASGGCLVVPGQHVRRDPRDLIRFIIDQGIEVADLPQSLIDVIMRMPTTFAEAPALRHLISAGEAVRVTPALTALLSGRPELTMHNHYGPAENHMVASHSMSAVAGNLEPRPPVGAMIWNTYIRILDEHGRHVPDGEIGEVHIGGVGLARGYTDPALTAAVFVADPFRDGARLYRTRDRGFWRPDGTLQLLGRIDDLIKIRGFAVEPREVEEHLTRCPGVRGAAVFARRRADASMELHAVLIGDPPPAVTLRRMLLEKLPDYLVPVRWWAADELPTGPNGKLDRKALPGPASRPISRVSHQEKISR